MTITSITPAPPTFEDPRQRARDILESSQAEDQRRHNREACERLLAAIKEHPVYAHPFLAALRAGEVSRADVLQSHLEFRAAIVCIFTDAILRSQFHTRQLEAQHGLQAKMAARFLITLNLLDEFGFVPGRGVGGYFRGDPLASHPCLYDEVVASLTDTTDTGRYIPSAESATIRRFVEDHYDDFIGLLVILAATEETAIIVCPAMRCGAEAVGVDVNRGYYMVHGSSEDEETHAFDDDHQNDIMFVLAHAMGSRDHMHAMRVAQRYCDLWQRFWDRAWRVHQPRHQLASGG